MSGPADQDSSKRIKQMVNFIEQEAREKAEEISVKSEEEFQIEKGRILNPERLKLNQEFDRKFKELEIQQKIAYSTQLNKARLKILEKRKGLSEEMVKEAIQELQSIKKNKENYKNIIHRLIVQGLIRIYETNVVVYTLKEDNDIANAVLSAATQEYKETMKKETGIDYSNVNVSLEKKEFLPENSMGGVLLKARKGKITLDNTLSSRLKVCQQSLAPIVRGRLFGVTKKVGMIEIDESENKHHG